MNKSPNTLLLFSGIFLIIFIILFFDIFGIHTTQEPEPEPIVEEPYEASEFVEELINAYIISEEYTRNIRLSSDKEGMVAKGAGYTLLYDGEGTVGIVSITDGTFIVLEYRIEQTLFRKTKIYFEWVAVHEATRIREIEAWGADHNPDDFILLDMSLISVLELFEELTQEDIYVIATFMR